MEEFYRPSLIGIGGPIAPTTVPGIDFVLRNHMWDAEVYYDTTTDVSAHYSETTFALREQIEVLGKQTAYTIQSAQHQPRLGHPNTVYYSDSDESDEDEPSEVLEVQRSIHPLSGNPTPFFDFVVESPSPSHIPCEDSDHLLESSGSTTTHFDYFLPYYDAFYFDDDHIEEKSSGSTTTYSDFSLPEYDLFIFDLSIDPFPPADRSDSHHEEFTNELAHIISPPEYDPFYFDLDIVPGYFTRVLKENIFDLSTKGLTINELNDSSLLLSDCNSCLSKEFYEIDLLVSFPSGNEDIIFDPGIFIIKIVQPKRFKIFYRTIFPLSHSSVILFS
uniref:Reverse transcriptase domain-containing protein n=1 Tax=Tanacetum cinerariifolium TaxID=118510 RepID=A0A6L2LUC5_TANCI|nr:hypothetical protein [Tanacetum cinerariifolium]